MTTDREYQQLQRRVRKLRQKQSQNKLIIFLIGFCCMLIFTLSYQNWGKINSTKLLLSLSSVLNTQDANLIKPNKIGDISLNNVDFTYIDQQAAALNYQGTSVTELAALLSQYAHSEAEKARIIFAWLAYHIDYDVKNYLLGNLEKLSPAEVLQYRKTICSGYSNLYKALALEMGLEAIVIEGYAKGYGYGVASDVNDINHAWNGVKINGSWYLVDSTWAAGHIKDNQFVRKFQPFYFAPEPQEFIISHLPINSEWQLLENKYSKEEFLKLVNVSPHFFQLGLNLVTPQENEIIVNNNLEIVIEAPSNIIATANLLFNGQEIDDKYYKISRNNNYLVIRVDFPFKGSYQLDIFAKESQNKGLYPHIFTYSVLAE